jgi:hypothetical protein
MRRHGAAVQRPSRDGLRHVWRPRAIVATRPVVENLEAAKILESSGLQPKMQRAALRGIADETMVYEIP